MLLDTGWFVLFLTIPIRTIPYYWTFSRQYLLCPRIFREILVYCDFGIFDIVYKPRRVKDTPNFISSGSKIVKRLQRRQYDPSIIERTIGLVLGPSTALYMYIPFLKHCTLTNKAVETIWRALSKPPQRRQGSDLRPLWLLVGTPSAIRPQLASRQAEHSLPIRMPLYIFFDI